MEKQAWDWGIDLGGTKCECVVLDGDEVLLRTRRGEVRVRAQLTGVVPGNTACIYHGWPEVEVNRLLHPDRLDPISGFPACKSLRCAIDKAPPLPG